MRHILNLKDDPFYKIKSGAKTIEMRLLDDKRKNIKAGDEIEFCRQENPQERVLTKVIALHIFKSFKELYENMDLTKCGYTEEQLPGAKYTDMQEYYPKEKQEQYGVVGIEIQKI